MKKNLLSKCRYYKGESSFPSELVSAKRGLLYWKAEKKWVESDGRAPRESLLLMVECGLSDEHLLLAGEAAEYLKIPLNLRAFLFETFCHYSDSAPGDNARYFLESVLPGYIG